VQKRGAGVNVIGRTEGVGVTQHLLTDLVGVLTRWKHELDLERPPSASVTSNEIPKDKVELARLMIDVRKKRASIFPPSLLGEPGFDILIGLYVAEAAGEALSTKQVCSMSPVPTTTAQRAIVELERLKLVSRREAGEDRRRTMVQLTDDGCALVDRYLDTLNAK
jgi:DNA-binding MarR family transcriptional regulator